MTARYVVDTSVVVQNLITDVCTPAVELLFTQAGDGVIELWVPDFCLIECANVLWKAARFRGLPPEQAAQLLFDLVSFPLYITPVAELLPRALALGLAHDLAVYDCIFIAMAERLTCPLITVDERQSEVAVAGGIPLKKVSEFMAGA